MKHKPTLALPVLITLALISITMLAGCSTTVALKNPTIAVTLPDKYNTPDGMVLGPDNYIYVNIPNFNDDSHPFRHE